MTTSLWHLNNTLPKFSPLSKNINVDAAIIGGGMTGLLTAYLLRKRGLRTVVIEKRRIGTGVTGDSAGKITVQHGAIYHRISQGYGNEMAQQYMAANLKALDLYEKIIRQEDIQCGFKKSPAYLYTLNENTRLLEQEYNAAVKAAQGTSLEISLTDKTELPFCPSLSMVFHNQAQFDPLAFLKGIMNELVIYEQTEGIYVDEGKVFTDQGNITADYIIFAGGYPFINIPGFYFLRMYQERSHVMGLQATETFAMKGMYQGIQKNQNSFRCHNDLLFIGGGVHPTGKQPAGGSFNMLKTQAQVYYPDFPELCRWSAQDCMTHDGIPYIGRFSKAWEKVYVATGFNQWGMTGAMAAAMILKDEITRQQNPYPIFSPERINIRAMGKSFLCHSTRTTKGMLKEKLDLPDQALENIPHGHGGIVAHCGQKYGVYKDTGDTAYMVSTKCTHMGCQLTWNPDELSWDCPCHGSRFDYEGNVLNSPAKKELDTTTI